MMSVLVGRDSSVGIATSYGLGGPGFESRWSQGFPGPTGPGAQQVPCTMGIGLFVGVERPGRGFNHPPPSSAEVKERVEVYLSSSSGPSWPLIGLIILSFVLLITLSFAQRRMSQIIGCLVNNELAKMWKVSWFSVRYSLVNDMEEQNKSTAKNPDRRSAGTNLKLGLPGSEVYPLLCYETTLYNLYWTKSYLRL